MITMLRSWARFWVVTFYPESCLRHDDDFLKCRIYYLTAHWLGASEAFLTVLTGVILLLFQVLHLSHFEVRSCVRQVHRKRYEIQWCKYKPQCQRVHRQIWEIHLDPTVGFVVRDMDNLHGLLFRISDFGVFKVCDSSFLRLLSVFLLSQKHIR